MNEARPRRPASSFASGVVWNFASLIFLATAGLALNVVIGRFYGPEDLGVFNICYGLFIFLSQFGSFGLQFSVLQAMAAREGGSQAECDEIVSAGLVAVAGAAVLATGVGLAATPLIAGAFDEPQVSTAWLAMLPGLFFFSINKYLFGVVNGARHMKSFAALQSLRYVLLLAALAALALMKAPGRWLTGVFTISEALLLPVLFVYASRAVSTWRLSRSSPWINRHLSYGARAFLSGAVLELNTRVDVLMIGALLDAAKAGVYTAALLVAEGASQAIFALRNNINPVIARMIAADERQKLLAFSRRIAIYFTIFMALASAAAIALYPLYIDLALGGGAFHESRASAAILLLGVTLSAGAQCFGMILAMAEKPALHTAYVVGVLAANLAFNVLLIPAFGIAGSALATALSYVFATIGVVVLARRALGLRLIF